MNTTVICLGKLKEKYLRDAIDEYLKRISKYCSISIIELPDKPIPEKSNSTLEAQIIEGESNEKPVVTLSNEGLIVDCIKPAEDGNGYIVRVYEPYGIPGKTVMNVTHDAKITEVSPLEEYIGECSGEITYKPFEFRTFRIICST